MNEEQKNIETCLAENILSEVANVPTDLQFRSLVEESFDPLQQQALRQAGYDGYKEVVMYHQPYTFTSSVKQMKSNLILLLRRLWRFPFGRGTIRSLADMWQHYITRLKGNPEYGIPSRLSRLSDLPDAPALLADRKITNGACSLLADGSPIDGIADGVSLARLLLCDYNLVTEIKDDNTPYIGTSTLWTIFPNLKKLTCNMKSITKLQSFLTGSKIEEVHFDYLEYVGLNGGGHHGKFLVSGIAAEEIEFPVLTNVDANGDSWQLSWGYFTNLPNCKKVSFPSLVTSRYGNCGDYTDHYFGNCPKLEEVHFPKATYGLQETNLVVSSGTNMGYNCPKLRDIEIGQGYNRNLYMAGWQPDETVLDGGTNQTTLLQNFHDHIALRLTDKGKGLTLTLSQEVRNAIHAAEDEYGIENIIITQKGWTISPAPN